ncbi:LysR family transcriptional regulator [Herbaspirillum sp. LeCh32-8]|uniref:LysR family transcriptional regulator n=1 Tax=Herbaspirillum sp. LeCh32-8 TaxID=2821356 RepID=UPI001AE2F931|nr:LysR substrate-binding domain-containing protein [Herbaspirillum sp. LeCh32-8]MBP0597260.1 LysR family transcriptional regulator [Herbaspirillum sp. LeCh32-8]
MQLRQLLYLSRIIESGSLSRASQLLHIAQPALSQQVNQLEDELGVKLLERSVRGVAATAAGLAVYQQAKLILKQVEATRTIAAQASHGPAGTVTIGLPWSLTTLIGVELLREVRTRLSLVRLEIVEGPSSLLLNLLGEGKLDIAVTFSDMARSGLSMHAVAREPLFLVGPYASLKDKDSMTLENAAALPMILMSSPNPVRDMLERHWLAAGLRCRVTAEINSPPLLLEAVKAGFGYSIVPLAGLEGALRNKEIDAVALAGCDLQRTVYVGTSRLFAQSPAIEQVAVTLRDVMRHAIHAGRWHALLCEPAPHDTA